MKTKLFALAAVLLLASLMAFGSARPVPTTQWEYKTETRCGDDKRLNALGAEGWELAGFNEAGMGGWHCIFKRPKN